MLALLLSGCVSFEPAPSDTSHTSSREKADPSKKLAAASPAMSEVLPPEWTVRNLNRLTARVEFSEGLEADNVECTISFFNTIKDPKAVSIALLVADGEIYPLEGLTVLFVKSETHELRISAVISRQSLVAALKAETLYLITELDRTEYQFEPDETFAAYKNRILKTFQ
jgi:hypothetical protein